MRKRTKARECALQILYQVDITQDSADAALKDYWSERAEEESVEEFAVKLVKGTCENKGRIDEVISSTTDNWTISRMAVVDRNVLRMAIYELLYCPDVPPKVCINEAIDIAKKFGDMDSGKFVNGILDKVHKNTGLKQTDSKQETPDEPSGKQVSERG